MRRGSSASSLERGRPSESAGSNSLDVIACRCAMTCRGALPHASTWPGIAAVTRRALSSTRPIGESSATTTSAPSMVADA